MSEVCAFCEEGATDERGEPMYYEELDRHAHIECAIENGVGQD